MPTITEPVIIDGYTQPGASANTNPVGQGLNAVLKIELDGTSAGAGIAGLTITASNSTLKGLVINNFGSLGVLFSGTGATGNAIEGNYIGTNVAGSAAAGNTFHGVDIFGASNNVIGGSVPAARDLLLGNGTSGVLIDSSGATGNAGYGNLIGTDSSGTVAIANQEHGASIIGAPNNQVGGADSNNRNVISGHALHGVSIFGSGATGNFVQGNFIGTDVTGTSALGNLGHGVNVQDSPNNNIGGTTTGARSVISGNSGASSSGVVIVGSASIGNVVLR